MLREQPHFFRDLHGLCAALGGELVEETARVGLDCVFADEEFFRDLSVRHSLGDQFEYFELAFGDAEVFQTRFI